MTESPSLHPFTLLFVAALLLSVALRFWLASRQVRHVARHRGAVPNGFADRIGLAAHQRAADYTIARVRLGIVETVVSAVLLIGFTMLGGLQWLMGAAQAIAPGSPAIASAIFVALVVLTGAIVDLPIEAWRRFRLEQRFGFNRMTPALFVADTLKGALVGAALGLPLLALVLWLMRASGELWWLWTWIAWMAFNLAVMVLFPTVIAPLFNRFEPLPEGEVRDRVQALLSRCGFRARGLFVMDGSRRSAHGNAYFTGLGRARRIVFFDTLLARLDADEIEAVLAHELGHFKLRHIPKRIALTFGISLAGLWLLGWLSRQPWFYQALGLTPEPAMADAAALVLFFLALPVFAFPLQPLFALASRRHEFQADAFAAAQTDPKHLASALVKLYEDNASTLTPDPVHSTFHDSHPPAVQRIGRLTAAPAT
ncbi:M48 family metallopeptidase [Zeimonas arvi]|uniref:M48 family metallopeptidase n=1 Tax=Zeimonas arvi TaxID=2498847 RepID=A0A5C8NQA5_9BURK|nr:M48 family metallopeptidase [Zeimonas arvi]TXL63492.1 M48 family metallopeptidase [Zeimonas arvi]